MNFPVSAKPQIKWKELFATQQHHSTFLHIAGRMLLGSESPGTSHAWTNFFAAPKLDGVANFHAVSQQFSDVPFETRTIISLHSYTHKFWRE